MYVVLKYVNKTTFTKSSPSILGTTRLKPTKKVTCKIPIFPTILYLVEEW